MTGGHKICLDSQGAREGKPNVNIPTGSFSALLLKWMFLTDDTLKSSLSMIQSFRPADLLSLQRSAISVLKEPKKKLHAVIDQKTAFFLVS